jgi:hypothetical protein
VRIHLSRRRTIVAVAAATVALGSAAAYAISLPELPVKLPGISLDLPIDLPSPLISPPDTQLPANPVVGPPDGDELHDITGILDPDGPQAPPKHGPSPAAAKRPAIAPQTASPSHSATDEAAAAAKELQGSKDLEGLLSHKDWSDEDWAAWAKDHADGSISVTIGQGVNICNNNNVKVIVNRDSSDDGNTIEQHSTNGKVTTVVNGHETDSTDDPGISCQH